jgi:SAM-dependent methyltransferase
MWRGHSTATRRASVEASDVRWRDSQAESRDRYLDKFDAAEVERYHAFVGKLDRQDEEAYLSDLQGVLEFRAGMKVLDAGAGTGALTRILARIPGLTITALEPAPAMMVKLLDTAELRDVIAVEGFCDSVDDRHHFKVAQFDAIVSRQLVNGLFDPLAAFRNWHYWLAPGGVVVVIDGLYGRSAWTGMWQEEVDVLPAAASQTTALTPYLLETAGFRVESVRCMEAVNSRPATKTPRSCMVART